MKRQFKPLLLAVAFAVTASSAAIAAVETHDAAQVQAGTYVLDPSHTLVAGRINHMGFSTTTIRFPKVSGKFTYDPGHPEAATLKVTMDTGALSTDWPARDTDLKGPGFFNVAKYPTMTFTAKSLTRIDASHAKVDGELTLLGVTKPVTLNVTLLAAGTGMMGDVRTGFEAHATIKRSDFGMTTFLPAVGDEVDIAIDAEFSRKK